MVGGGGIAGAIFAGFLAKLWQEVRNGKPAAGDDAFRFHLRGLVILVWRNGRVCG